MKMEEERNKRYKLAYFNFLVKLFSYFSVKIINDYGLKSAVDLYFK